MRYAGVGFLVYGNYDLQEDPHERYARVLESPETFEVVLGRTDVSGRCSEIGNTRTGSTRKPHRRATSGVGRHATALSKPPPDDSIGAVSTAFPELLS